MAASKRKSFALRIAPDLWKEIEAWAQQDFRSVNGQIEFLLREAVRRRKGDKFAHPSTAENDNED